MAGMMFALVMGTGPYRATSWRHIHPSGFSSGRSTRCLLTPPSPVDIRDLPGVKARAKRGRGVRSMGRGVVILILLAAGGPGAESPSQRLGVFPPGFRALH